MADVAAIALLLGRVFFLTWRLWGGLDRLGHPPMWEVFLDDESFVDFRGDLGGVEGNEPVSDVLTWI